MPDLTVLLDLPPEVGLARARGRAAADRLESESLDFHQRVRATFLALAEADPDRYLVLDARQPADELAAQIRRRVAEPALRPAAADPARDVARLDRAGRRRTAAAGGAPSPPARPDRADPPAAPVTRRRWCADGRLGARSIGQPDVVAELQAAVAAARRR